MVTINFLVKSVMRLKELGLNEETIRTRLSNLRISKDHIEKALKQAKKEEQEESFGLKEIKLTDLEQLLEKKIPEIKARKIEIKTKETKKENNEIKELNETIKAIQGKTNKIERDYFEENKKLIGLKEQMELIKSTIEILNKKVLEIKTEKKETQENQEKIIELKNQVNSLTENNLELIKLIKEILKELKEKQEK